MTVFVCVNAKNGAFLNVFSNSELASEYRRSAEHFSNLKVTILTTEIDSINSWEVYYEV